MRERITSNPTKLRDIPTRTGQNVFENLINNVKANPNAFMCVASAPKYRDFDFFNRISLAEDPDAVVSNPIYIIELLLRRYTNIEIDTDKFDNTAGSIIPMAFNFSLNEEISLMTLINELLYPIFGVLYFDGGKWRISTLWVKDISGVISDCLKRNGEKQIKVYWDTNLFSSFVFNEQRNPVSGKYLRTYSIDKNRSDVSMVGINPETICNDIETTYGIKRKYEYNSRYTDSIYNSIRPIFEYYTTLKMIVEVELPLKDGIAYELGDYVKVDIPDVIPSNYNNTKDFVIIAKEVKLLNTPFDPSVRLQLMSVPFSGYY